ncbi:hypothetical protein ACWGA0_16090 [Streptomyces erythrochromogenes]
MAVIDTRLIQTAVIGSRDSDQAVILPEEPHNLDQFRLRFGTDRFWCGTLLGGCGEKLMSKRYEVKVCHFSHYPDPHGIRDCHRTANGVESADHLFIKKYVKEWLAEQGHAALAELRSHGHGPGDAVDFRMRATNQLLRFELRSEDYRSWRRAAASLAAASGHVEWVFGSDSPLVDDMIARQGYALRVRCETSGADRHVLIGVVDQKKVVTWAPLDDCLMTADGLITPALEDLRAAGIVRRGGIRNPPLPASLPLRGSEIVFAVDNSVTPPADSPLATDNRYLISAYLKPAGSRIVPAHISLPSDTPVPTEDFVYQLTGLARVLITDPIGSGMVLWSIRADGLTRLNGLEAERTGLWLPSVSVVKPPSSSAAKMPTRPQAQEAPPRRSREATLLRSALLTVATNGTRTTWEEISRKTGLDLSHLSDIKRRDLLIEVDGPLDPDVPLLSVLVREKSGRILPYLRTVLRILGADAPASDSALQQWCTREAGRAYAKHQPPTGAVAEPETPRSRRPIFMPSPASVARVQALQGLVLDAKQLLPRTSGRRASRLKEAVKQAEIATAAFENARSKGREYPIDVGVLDELERVIGRPVLPGAGARHATTGTTRPVEQALVPPARSEPRVSSAEMPPRVEVQGDPLSEEEVLARLRYLLEELSCAGDGMETLDLRSAMAHAKILKRRHRGSLPEDLQTMFDGCNTLLEQKLKPTVVPAEGQSTAATGVSAPDSPVVATTPPAPTAPQAEGVPRLSVTELADIASALRAVLEDVARHQTTITWSGIRQRMSRDLPRLHPDDQGEALVLVDRDTPSDEPLLAALIVVGDREIHPLYRHVAFSLDRELPLPENGLQSRWQMDVLRLHTLWRHR